MSIFQSNFFIAEIGVNHIGKIDVAFKHIDLAKIAGFNAVKFQFIDTEKIWHKNCDESIKLSQKESFPYDWFEPLREYAHKNGLLIGHTPTFQNASKIIKDHKSDFIKIASPQAEFDRFILDEAIATNLPLIISNGYSDFNSSLDLINYVSKYQRKIRDIAFLYCIAKYPADMIKVPYEEAENLCQICNEKKINFGFSDHFKSILPALNLSNIGANVFEKHISIENIDSLDSEVSINELDAINYINQIKLISNNSIFIERESTFENKSSLFSSSLIFKVSVKKGDIFSLTHFSRYREGVNSKGVQTDTLWKFLNKFSSEDIYYNKNIAEGENLTIDDIN